MPSWGGYLKASSWVGALQCGRLGGHLCFFGGRSPISTMPVTTVTYATHRLQLPKVSRSSGSTVLALLLLVTPEKPKRTLWVVHGRDPRPQFHGKPPQDLRTPTPLGPPTFSVFGPPLLWPSHLLWAPHPSGAHTSGLPLFLGLSSLWALHPLLLFLLFLLLLVLLCCCFCCSASVVAAVCAVICCSFCCFFFSCVRLFWRSCFVFNFVRSIFFVKKLCFSLHFHFSEKTSFHFCRSVVIVKKNCFLTRTRV